MYNCIEAKLSKLYMNTEDRSLCLKNANFDQICLRLHVLCRYAKIANEFSPFFGILSKKVQIYADSDLISQTTCN